MHWKQLRNWIDAAGSPFRGQIEEKLERKHMEIKAILVVENRIESSYRDKGCWRRRIQNKWKRRGDQIEEKKPFLTERKAG